MKWLFCIVALCMCCLSAKTQELAVENISKALRNRANAVIRNSYTTTDMRSADIVLMRVSKAITVFNKSGDIHGQLVLMYDRNTAIRSVKGEVYDEFGKQTGKFSLSHLKDESAVSDFSLFEDSRVKYYIPQINTYPYTIVYQYEIRNKQNLIIPTWRPIPGFDVAVEKSSYQFICNPKDELRTWATAYQGEPLSETTDKLKSITWQITNVAATKYESYAPEASTYFTSVKVAPKDFTYYNFKGSYTDWEGLGKLSYDYLLKDKRALPQETVLKVKELIKGLPDDKAKAKKLYEYLQQKTRYISVQIGIGGFQPMKASDVDRLGYGDCKGLVNYMQALLDVAGIESYYCVVSAGQEKTSLIPAFASMEQGNHIILCLPLNGDTTWLECTSQDTPFGYLGDFTDDRWVLACTKDGGKLLRTPKYDGYGNEQLRKANLVVTENGTIEGSVITKFTGLQFDNHYYSYNQTPIEREKSLKKIYDINNIEFKSINLSVNKDLPEFQETLSVSIAKYVSIMNDKLHLIPNLFNQHKSIPALKNRKLPLHIKRSFVDIDSVTISIPNKLIPIPIPRIVKLDTKFGTYVSELSLKDNVLTYFRKLHINEGEFEASDYEGYQEFINEVASNDRYKAILSLQK